MRPHKKERLLTLFGLLLFFIGLTAVINTAFVLDQPTGIIWFCYIALLLMGWGVLQRNTFLIMSQVYILLIPMVVWNLDFWYQFITGSPLWGITNYFFVERALNIGKFISLQHFFSVPLAIYATILIGRTRTDEWKLSILEIFFLFIITRAITDPVQNINCVFYACVDISLGLPHEPTWFILYGAMIATTAVILNVLPGLRIKKV